MTGKIYTTDVITQTWKVEHQHDRLDSSEDTIRILDDSPDSQNHPQGPLVIANVNARAFAPYLETPLAYAAAMAAAPQMLKALQLLLKAYDEILPGIANICVQDFALINDAPIAARAAIRDATSFDVNEFEQA